MQGDLGVLEAQSFFLPSSSSSSMPDIYAGSHEKAEWQSDSRLCELSDGSGHCGIHLLLFL